MPTLLSLGHAISVMRPFLFCWSTYDVKAIVTHFFQWLCFADFSKTDEGANRGLRRPCSSQMPAPWLILPNLRVRGDPPTSQPPFNSPAWPLSLISRELVATPVHPPPLQPLSPHSPLLQGVVVMMNIGWRLDELVSNVCHCLIKFDICTSNSILIFAKLFCFRKNEMFFCHSIQKIPINLAINCTLYISLNGLSTCPNTF